MEIWSLTKLKRISSKSSSVLLYSCTTLTQTKHLEKKLDGNYTRMVCAVLNKSWKQQLYSHLLIISQTIQVKLARHSGHCWGRKINSLATFSYELLHLDNQQKLTFISSVQTLGYHLDNLPNVMTSRDRLKKRVKGIWAVNIPWW